MGPMLMAALAGAIATAPEADRTPAAGARPAIVVGGRELGLRPLPAVAVLRETPGGRRWELVPAGEAEPRDLARSLGGAAAYATPVFADTLGGPMYPRPEVLVAPAPGADRGVLARSIRRAAPGAEVAADGPGGLLRVRPHLKHGEDVLRAAAAIAALPGVGAAEPDMAFTGRGALVPNDPLFMSSWHLMNTSAPGIDLDVVGAWDRTMGSADVIVAVFDTGVDLDHPDLDLAPGIDTTWEATLGGAGGPMNPCDRHGTPVAGIVAGLADNLLGAVGVAPGVRAAPIRFAISASNCSGSWSSGTTEFLAALDYAEAIGARVSVNSNYFGFSSGLIAGRYADLRDGGMVHFASAGNNAAFGSTYPASLASVNSVSAIQWNGVRASFSNFGPDVDFAAPGVSVQATDVRGANGYSGGDYTAFNGTSAAAPAAAGVAALIVSYRPELTAAEVEDVMRQTALDLGAGGRDDQYGHGLPHAAAALAALTPLGGCPADIVPDGQVDVSDLLGFLGAFRAQGDAADFDGSGSVDVNDLLGFLGAFRAGC